MMKMFQKIQELIDDPEALVCVLIDEVISSIYGMCSSGKNNHISWKFRSQLPLKTQVQIQILAVSSEIAMR